MAEYGFALRELTQAIVQRCRRENDGLTELEEVTVAANCPSHTDERARIRVKSAERKEVELKTYAQIENLIDLEEKYQVAIHKKFPISIESG